MIIHRIVGGALVRGNGRHTLQRRLALAAGGWLLAMSAPAQTFNVLYTFSGAQGNPDGGNPSGLTLSTNGNFYGVCVNGGLEGWGALCQLTPTGTLTPVYSFTNGPPAPYDGANPYAALTQGTNGLLYGTAQSGGSNGYGSIFDVKTNGTLTSLHAFSTLVVKGKTGLLTNADGALPKSALVLNTNNGNFYGTAEQGGTNNYGTAFQVTHQGKVSVFYSFSNSVDGATPAGPLLLYTNGSLYGTASGGGSNGYGALFQLTAAGRVTPIYSFTNGADGANPQGALIDGQDGHLYGTCAGGGLNGTGTIFRITTNGVITPLYSFSPGTNLVGGGQYNADGINPNMLLPGSDGNFYGTAFKGGLNGAGSVFQFTRSGALNVLYSFSSALEGANSDGAYPTSLIQDTNGNLYGTAFNGGSNNFGTFFTIGLPPAITAQPASQFIALHGNASFGLTALGAHSCQWQFDGTNLPNATNDTLSITNAQMADAGSYQAIVSNINGPAASSVVTLNITNVPVTFLSGAGALQYGAGQFSIQFANLTGQGAIVIEASTNLIQWAPIYTNPSGFGAAQFIDSEAGNYPVRYYRATTP